MPVTVSIPRALRTYAGNLDTVELDGTSVADIIRSLTAKFPTLKAHLCSASGSMHDSVTVYLNDENIRYLDKLDTAVVDGDTLTLVPSVAGRPDTALSSEEMERYSRHLIMPEVGLDGQKKLKAASILLVGAGGLGSPLGLYLSAAGVGRIGLVDYDVVDYTNLQRQVLHGTKDVGRSKLESARERMHDINPHVQIDTYETRLSSDNAMEIIAPYDIVIDGTDNFPTRYLVNDACVLLGKPNVYGSIFRFEGQASVFDATRGPCYRCLYPEPPPPGTIPSCAEGGVLGILPGIIGLIQATEAIKLIIGKGEPLIGRLLLFDALEMKFREMKLKKDPACPLCGEHPSITGLIDYEQFCGIRHASAQDSLAGELQVSASELSRELQTDGPIVLLDVREHYETELCSIPQSTAIPMGQLQSRITELNRDSHIVVYCRSGERSAHVVNFLQEQGFKHARNLAGGILAWADQVDPTLQKY